MKAVLATYFCVDHETEGVVDIALIRADGVFEKIFEPALTTLEDA